MDIGSSNNHVGESSRTALAMVASTVMVEDTKRVPSIEPVTKNISLEGSMQLKWISICGLEC